MELGSSERLRYERTKKALETCEKPRGKPKYFCDPDEKMQKRDTSIKQRDKLAQELVAVRSDLAGIRRSLGLCSVQSIKICLDMFNMFLFNPLTHIFISCDFYS